MAADDEADDLPISWDEAREVVIVVATMVAVLMMLSPLAGFIDSRFPGTFGDHVAELTRMVGPTSGLALLVAGILIATTPPADVVPALRRFVAVVAVVVVIAGVAAITVELTRPSPTGVAGRLQSVFGRSGPGTMLAATARWLSLRVVPFDDRAPR